MPTKLQMWSVHADSKRSVFVPEICIDFIICGASKRGRATMQYETIVSPVVKAHIAWMGCAFDFEIQFRTWELNCNCTLAILTYPILKSRLLFLQSIFAQCCSIISPHQTSFNRVKAFSFSFSMSSLDSNNQQANLNPYLQGSDYKNKEKFVT